MASRPYAHRRAQKLAKQRDSFMCFICAEVSSKAEGHHMLLHSEDGLEMVENIVTLCKQCHKNYHAGELRVNFYLRDIG